MQVEEITSIEPFSCLVKLKGWPITKNDHEYESDHSGAVHKKKTFLEITCQTAFRETTALCGSVIFYKIVVFVSEPGKSEVPSNSEIPVGHSLDFRL